MGANALKMHSGGINSWSEEGGLGVHGGGNYYALTMGGAWYQRGPNKGHYTYVGLGHTEGNFTAGGTIGIKIGDLKNTGDDKIVVSLRVGAAGAYGGGGLNQTAVYDIKNKKWSDGGTGVYGSPNYIGIAKSFDKFVQVETTQEQCRRIFGTDRVMADASDTIRQIMSGSYIDYLMEEWSNYGIFKTDPATGGIASGFGSRIHPKTGIWTFHDGIDKSIGDGYGYATWDGEVAVSKYSPTGGEMVVVQFENGYYGKYLHLSERYVNVGDIVSAGDNLGHLGDTGFSKGPHLHFTLYDSDWNAIDPTPLLR